MPFPRLSNGQLERVIQQVAEYIERQRQTYRSGAVPLNAGQKAAMQPFFLPYTLESARVLVLPGERDWLAEEDVTKSA